MDSMALWYDKDIKIELDVNIFTSSTYSDYVEFGLKCCILSEIKTTETKLYEVYLYLPFHLAKRDIVNIPLSSDLELIGSMFNEDMEISIKKYTSVKYKKSNTAREFCIRNLYDFDVENTNGGSTIKIEVKHSMNECCNYYYRFRVKKLAAFVNSFNDNIPFVDWVFKKSKHLDFTVNKLDKLPNMIVDKMKHFESKIYKINFFLITNDKLNLVSSNSHHNIKTASKIWKRHYLHDEKSKKSDNLIIYHYREKDVFMKFQEIKHNTWLVLSVLFVIIITVVSSFIAIFGCFK